MPDTEGHANVVTLDDFRPSKDYNGPCRVTFFGPLFKNAEGEMDSLRMSVDIPDANYADVIRRVAEGRGQFVPGVGGQWFFPWPCAAVWVGTIPPACGEDPQAF